MRASDSEYDPRRWHAAEMKRRPRRRSTRWALLGGLLLVMLLPAIEMTRPGDHGQLFPNVFPICMLLIMGTTWSPFAREAFLTDGGFAAFDEFEQAALLAALRRAYLVTLLIVIALFTWLALGQKLGWPIPHLPRQWFAIGFALFVTVISLPVTIAEWTVPFPDAEDQPL